MLRTQSAPDLRPFVFEGRPYERIGATTSVMPQERYQQLLLARLQSRARWETAAADGISSGDLDYEEVLRTVRSGATAGRLPIVTSTDLGDLLDRLRLRRGNELSNAAVVLFGSASALRDYPQCVLRLARFKGTSKAQFLDSRQVHGNAFALLDEAMIFISRHLPIASRIEPGQVARIEEPLFPPDALREALVNALCHRDYGHVSGSVSLGIYDDRWEIWSTGSLPPGVRLEDLKRDHQSYPRNPLIADVFYRRGLVEAWGRGTQRIIELCVAAGRPEPEFLEQGQSFGVRFLPGAYSPPYRVPYDLAPRQREILQILSRRDTVTTIQIQEELSTVVENRTLRRDLEELSRLGLIRPIGRTRGRLWSLEHPSSI